jgi:hypothetical protein
VNEKFSNNAQNGYIQRGPNANFSKFCAIRAKLRQKSTEKGYDNAKRRICTSVLLKKTGF